MLPASVVIIRDNLGAAIIKVKESIFRTGNPKMGTKANIEDPDEMPHKVALITLGFALFAKTLIFTERKTTFSVTL